MEVWHSGYVPFAYMGVWHSAIVVFYMYWGVAI